MYWFGVHFFYILNYEMELNLTAEVCDEVECGRGKCKVDGSSPVGFICECDANWKQFNHDHHHDDDDDDHRFLPCVIPNCKRLIVIFIFSFSTS